MEKVGPLQRKGLGGSERPTRKAPNEEILRLRSGYQKREEKDRESEGRHAPQRRGKPRICETSLHLGEVGESKKKNKPAKDGKWGKARK